MIGLDQWESNDVAYYGKSALFIHFLYEQFGFEFIQLLFNDSEQQRLNSVINQLASIDIYFKVQLKIINGTFFNLKNLILSL